MNRERRGASTSRPSGWRTVLFSINAPKPHLEISTRDCFGKQSVQKTYGSSFSCQCEKENESSEEDAETFDAATRGWS